MSQRHRHRHPRLYQNDVGARVRKEFEDGFFNGTIVGVTEEGHYHVRYDDDDAEDMSEDETLVAAANYEAYMRIGETLSIGECCSKFLAPRLLILDDVPAMVIVLKEIIGLCMQYLVTTDLL